MKLHGLGIIFALIVLPIILVMTYYIQLQVDTLILQKKYDSKLLDSTYDALSAFELNTANEDLSTVSDSLRTIVEASSNVFFTTLATNLGMSSASKSNIEPYIPSLLFTLYDGYYISAPTQVPTVVTDIDGNAVAVGDLGVKQASAGVYTYNPDLYADSKKFGQTPPDQRVGMTDPAVDGDNYLSSETLTNVDEFGHILYETNTDGRYTANIANAKKTTKNVLKNYMPYSARYQQGTGTDFIDVTVNYTLDNFLNIEGTIKGEYYTKSGYLLPENCINVIVKHVDENRTVDILKYNQEQAQEIIESGSYKTTLQIKEYDSENVLTTIEVDRPNVEAKENNIISLKNKITELRNISTADSLDSIKATINAITPYSGYFGIPASIEEAPEIIKKMIASLNVRITEDQYILDETSAIVYYTKAAIFSKWVHTELGKLQENSIVEVSGQKYQIVGNDYESEVLLYDFSELEDTSYVFDLKRKVNAVTTTEKDENLNAGVTEINKSSTFYRHKYNVIRNSIQYNLNLAMSTYNSTAHVAGYDYQMPVMQNDEWDRILNNVSIVSFMQGIKCGLKKYNNYKVVSSTNNEIVVTPENIYYVLKSSFNNEESEYHRIDCKKLYERDTLADYDYMSFSSKEVKYDKQYDKNRFYAYTYDHMNLACYDCINDHNNEVINIFDPSAENYKDAPGLTKAYYIAVGKERNNIYKMNAFVNSQGYEVLNGNTTSSRGLNEIKSIEVVVGTVKSLDLNETILTYKPYIKSGANLIDITDAVYSFPANSLENHTLTIQVKPDLVSTRAVGKTTLFFDIQQDQSSAVFKGSQTKEPGAGDIGPTYGSITGVSDEDMLEDAILKSYIQGIRVIYK